MKNKPDNKQTESFAAETAKEVGKELVSEAKTTLKWALGGAVVGAVVLGGAGWVKFGPKVGMIGAGVGAIVCGAVAAWFYLSARTFTD